MIVVVGRGLRARMGLLDGVVSVLFWRGVLSSPWCVFSSLSAWRCEWLEVGEVWLGLLVCGACAAVGGVGGRCSRWAPWVCRGALEGSRGVLEGSRGSLEASRGVLEGSRGALEGSRGLLEGSRGALDGSRGALEGCRVG